MRRLALAIICLLIWAISAGTAMAVNDVDLEVIQAPPTGSVLRGDDPFPITMRARADSSLKSFSVLIAPAENPRPGMEVVDGSTSGSWPTGAKTSETLSVSWNTKNVTPYNGLYRIIATAESHVGGTKTIRLDGYAVDNLPIAVSGIVSEIKGTDPSLNWQANSEIDLISYRVYRAVGSSGYKNIAVTTTTAYADKEVPKGVELKYYVTATRRSVVSKEGWVESLPSKATSFFIPHPQSNAEPTVSAPQEAPAPPPIPNVEARPAGKIVHHGFGELIPYGAFDDSLPKVPAPLSQQEGPAILQPRLKSPAPISLPQVYKPPFFAAALLMIAAAAHIGRLAISMFVDGEKRRSTDGHQAEPASSF